MMTCQKQVENLFLPSSISGLDAPTRSRRTTRLFPPRSTEGEAKLIVLVDRWREHGELSLSWLTG